MSIELTEFLIWFYWVHFVSLPIISHKIVYITKDIKSSIQIVEIRCLITVNAKGVYKIKRRGSRRFLQTSTLLWSARPCKTIRISISGCCGHSVPRSPNFIQSQLLQTSKLHGAFRFAPEQCLKSFMELFFMTKEILDPILREQFRDWPLLFKYDLKQWQSQVHKDRGESLVWMNFSGLHRVLTSTP